MMISTSRHIAEEENSVGQTTGHPGQREELIVQPKIKTMNKEVAG
jgi:hypothetical protein